MRRRPMARFRELPPTAGLPLKLSDLVGGGGDFERQAAAFLGVEALQLECSGTAAFIVALRTLHRRTGRRNVIVPAYTCPLVAIAVAQCRLDLVVCDTERGGFGLDIGHLSRLADQDTLAIVPTHLGGRQAELDDVYVLARHVGAAVIEDAAQSFGAKSNGQALGVHADATFYSFAAGKGLTLYEGGLLFTPDEDLRRDMQALSRATIRPDPAMERRRSIELAAYALLYNPIGLVFAYGRPLRRGLAAHVIEEAIGDRFSLEAPLHTVGSWRRGVAAKALSRLPAFLKATAERAKRRRLKLLSLPGVDVLGDAPGNDGTWPFLMVLMPDRTSRDRALEMLWKKGLGVTRLFAYALPDYDYLKSIVPRIEVPNARDFASRLLTVTNSPFMTEPEFDLVALKLQDAIRAG